MIRFWRRPDAHMSREWLKAHSQRESRIEFHGVQIRFPIRKALNELGWINRIKLRKAS